MDSSQLCCAAGDNDEGGDGSATVVTVAFAENGHGDIVLKRGSRVVGGAKKPSVDFPTRNDFVEGLKRALRRQLPTATRRLYGSEKRGGTRPYFELPDELKSEAAAVGITVAMDAAGPSGSTEEPKPNKNILSASLPVVVENVPYLGTDGDTTLDMFKIKTDVQEDSQENGTVSQESQTELDEPQTNLLETKMELQESPDNVNPKKPKKLVPSPEVLRTSAEFRFELALSASWNLNAVMGGEDDDEDEQPPRPKSHRRVGRAATKSLPINTSSAAADEEESNKKKTITTSASVSLSAKKKSVANAAVDATVWLKKAPIFVADGRAKRTPRFPDRKRHSLCFVCGERDDGALNKCSASGCSVMFHEICARLHVDGGYTIDFMQRNRGTYCPRHHCTSCFSDHNRVRCYNGALVRCAQCELAWHPDCIPAGCELNAKSEIVCPRHIVFANPTTIHTTHCADCQQKDSPGEQLIRCDSCLRSLHENCYRESSLVPLPVGEMLNVSASGAPVAGDSLIGRCNWCRSYDFVRYGQFCMGRLGSSKWYPCQVVRNDDYPRQEDPNLRRVGYMVVKWLPYQNRTFFNLITHNRVLPMTEMDYFFVTEAKQSNIYKEWELAQQHAVENSPENSVPKPDQISQHFSNGERVRKIARCKYSSTDLRPLRGQLQTADMCLCPANAADRCGPSSTCINRALRVECPKQCEERGGCANRALSEGQNCVSVSIQPYHGRYFGAVTLVDIPECGFVGEYVGEIITHEEKQRRIEQIARMKSIEAQYYIMDLDAHRAIDAMYYGNDMRYVNHSCHPNCTVQVISSDMDIHLVLVALRKINKGEELSFDYNMYSTNSGRAVPKCRCNAVNCSGILSAAGAQNNGSSSSRDAKEKEAAPSRKRPLASSENIPSSRSKSTGGGAKSAKTRNWRRTSVNSKRAAAAENIEPAVAIATENNNGRSLRVRKSMGKSKIPRE